MENYEINVNTLAIIALNENQTKIFEDDKDFVINNNSLKIMEDSCQFFGSSLNGRQKGTSHLIGITHKAPIIIEETKEIIFFPTNSPRIKTCSWISLNNLEKYYKEKGKIALEFKNKKKILLNTTYGIIDNQILRATRLESVLRKRKDL